MGITAKPLTSHPRPPSSPPSLQIFNLCGRRFGPIGKEALCSCLSGRRSLRHAAPQICPVSARCCPDCPGARVTKSGRSKAFRNPRWWRSGSTSHAVRVADGFSQVPSSPVDQWRNFAVSGIKQTDKVVTNRYQRNLIRRFVLWLRSLSSHEILPHRDSGLRRARGLLPESAGLQEPSESKLLEASRDSELLDLDERDGRASAHISGRSPVFCSVFSEGGIQWLLSTSQGRFWAVDFQWLGSRSVCVYRQSSVPASEISRTLFITARGVEIGRAAHAPL